MDSIPKIRAILFDMDGVLLDSEAYICQAAVGMFREKGYPVKPEDFLEFTGMGENKYLGGVAEKRAIPFQLEKDKARTYEIYAELVAGKLFPYPGAIQFLEKCHAFGLKMALASSADPTKICINLAEIGIPQDTFHTIVSGLDIEHKKPAPDIFLRAAANLGIEPEDCLVIEDAISGVTAGKAAGAKVLALTTTFAKEELSQADWIAESLVEFLPQLREMV
ncbi:MAG: HAD-IA family hydrolase [Pirellulales bacterium]|nr:HAD-IA family hydrolase [Pirellulales bacterium]